MALRYWVGGTANWDSTAGTKWSTTDGGAGGAAVPTAADDVFLTAASGANTVTISATSVAKSLTCTGFTGTLAGSSQLTVSGNVTLVAGMTNSYTGTLIINATSTINTNGINIYQLSTITAVTYTLASNVTITNTWFTNTGSGPTISGAFNIEITGNWNCNSTSGSVTFSGGATVTLSGNSTWTGYSLAGISLINANITINSTSTIITGFISLGNNSTLTYTAGTITTTGSTLLLRGTGITLNTNGITWYNLSFSITTISVTFSSDFTASNLVTIGVTSTLNGSNLIVTGSLTHSTVTTVGTATIIFAGTGTWSHTSAGAIRNNVIINTAGILTLGTTVRFDTGTLTYTSGTVITTGNTLIIAASTTLNTSGINWNDVTFSASSATFTLTTDLNIGGTFTQSSGSNITFNGADVYCNGSVIVFASNAINITGTSDFFFIGTGTWSGAQAFNCNITITGTYTVSGTVGLTGDCVFTCITGTLITIGSTFSIPISSSATITINTNQALNNLSSGTATFTLSQDLTLTGTLAYLNNTTITFNGNTLYIGGSLTLLASTIAAGTTNFILNGTGTWGLGTVRNNLTINTSGTITISGSVAYNTGTLTYTSGTVVTTGSTLTIAISTTLNTSGMSWNNIILSATLTLTINSLLSISGNLTYNSGTIITCAGTSGWTAANFFILTSNNISHVLASGKTYTVTTYFESIATTSSLKDSLISGTPGTKAIFTLNYGATQNVGYTNATDIDSSRGQTIWTFNGTVTTTFNWNAFTSSSGNQKTYII